MSTTPFAELVVATNFSFLRGASHARGTRRARTRARLHDRSHRERNTFAGVVRAHTAAKDAGLRTLTGVPPGHGVRLRSSNLPERRAAPTPASRAFSPKAICAPPRASAHHLRRSARSLRGSDLHRNSAGNSSRRAVSCSPCSPCSPCAAALLSRSKPSTSAAGMPNASRSHIACRQPRMPLAPPTTCLYHDRAAARSPSHGLYSRRHDASRRSRLPSRSQRRTAFEIAAELARLFRPHPAPSPKLHASQPKSPSRSTNSLRVSRRARTRRPHPMPISPTSPLDLTPPSVYPEGIPPAIKTQVANELALIAKLDYARYFLTVYDIVPLQGAAVSCVRAAARPQLWPSATCSASPPSIPRSLDSPLRALHFARAARTTRHSTSTSSTNGAKRSSNTSSALRRARAAICATVIHYRARMAIREVGKVLGLKEDVTGALANNRLGHVERHDPGRADPRCGPRSRKPRHPPSDPACRRTDGLPPPSLPARRRLRADARTPRRNRPHHERRHGGSHLHRMGQGRHRRARHSEGRHPGARHAVRDQEKLRSHREGLWARPHPRLVPQDDPKVYEMLSGR